MATKTRTMPSKVEKHAAWIGYGTIGFTTMFFGAIMLLLKEPWSSTGIALLAIGASLIVSRVLYVLIDERKPGTLRWAQRVVNDLHEYRHYSVMSIIKEKGHYKLEILYTTGSFEDNDYHYHRGLFHLSFNGNKLEWKKDLSDTAA